MVPTAGIEPASPEYETGIVPLNQAGLNLVLSPRIKLGFTTYQVVVLSLNDESEIPPAVQTLLLALATSVRPSLPAAS